MFLDSLMYEIKRSWTSSLTHKNMDGLLDWAEWARAHGPQKFGGGGLQ